MARNYVARVSALPLSDGGAFSIVVSVAVLIRLAFLFRAPPLYVGGDSQTYLLPAVELLQGVGFDPDIKRPPAYPLFLAALLAFLGPDLQGVNLVQHVLGVVTAAATWAIGRLTYGRIAGLLAGLMTAINGPLLIFEHYIMAETLATCLLALGLLVTIGAARHPSWRGLVLAGLLFGLAGAAHQRTLMLIGLVPLALLLARRGWRISLQATGLALLGFLAIVLPWTAFDYARHQVMASGALGEHLTWRLTRNGDDQYFRGRLNPVADLQLHQARRFTYEQAANRTLPGDIKASLQQRFGFNHAQADGLMRSLAIEAIAQKPDRYVSSSFSLLMANLLGSEQWLGGQGREGGRTRYADVQSKYEEWWSERTQPLVQNATPAQEREFRRAQALAEMFQPHRFGWPLLALFVLGVVVSIGSPAHRLGLVPAAGALGMLVAAAFLSGALPRFRYPAEPMLAVVQTGAPATAVGMLGQVLPWPGQTHRRAAALAGRT
jgi:4-amino-4-deoxy-L-arabinose transferase-like glycosyltransferase